MSYYGFGWQHTFQFVGTGFSIYHGLPQEVFSSLLENNSFSSAVLSSRTIAEGVLQLRYTASKLECMPSSVSERLKESILNRWIVIDMFDASCIFYQDVAGIVVALGNAVLHRFPKRNREILVGKLLPQGAVGIGRHLGCLYGNNAPD